MNILLKADDIVNKRAEEKEREYGPFEDSMQKTAIIATELCGKEISSDDVYKVMIALKLSRLAYNTKEDTMLDLVAYVAAFNNKKNNTTWQEKQKPNAKPVNLQNSKPKPAGKGQPNAKPPKKPKKVPGHKL